MKNGKLMILMTLCALLLALTACTGAPAATTTAAEAPHAQTTTAAAESADPGSENPLWAEALYTADAELGEGKTTVKVTVEAEGKSVVFTLHTDRTILGDALVDNKLVEGEEGPYGLYIKKVNGILADYDVNQRYWSFSKGGEAMMTGVDGQTIADGEAYELVYAK